MNAMIGWEKHALIVDAHFESALLELKMEILVFTITSHLCIPKVQRLRLEMRFNKLDNACIIKARRNDGMISITTNAF